MGYMSYDGMRVEVIERLDNADRAAWDTLAARQSFYAGTSWLDFQRGLEKSGAVQHVCVRSAGRLVAAVAVFVVDQPSSGNYDPRRLFPDVAVPAGPTTLVGSSRGFHSAPLTASDEALDLLLDGVQQVADEHSDGHAWWLYTRTQDAALIADRVGVVPRLLNGECVIDLPGTGFDDYLAGLPSSRRADVRRDLRAFGASGLRLVRARLSDHVELCGALLGATQRKHGLAVSDEAMTDWLRGLCRVTADSGRLYLCVADDVPIGFSLGYTTGGTSHLRAVGFDYDRAPHIGEYFELLCYQPIRDSYTEGASAVHLGSGAYHAKARRGAHVRPLWAVPTRVDAWKTANTKAHNAERADELVAELPRADDLVWTDRSEGWL
jgi:predicted N-acyltransferase